MPLNTTLFQKGQNINKKRLKKFKEICKLSMEASTSSISFCQIRTIVVVSFCQSQLLS